MRTGRAGGEAEGGGEVEGEVEGEGEACARQGCSPEGLAEQLGRQDRQGQAAS